MNTFASPVNSCSPTPSQRNSSNGTEMTLLSCEGELREYTCDLVSDDSSVKKSCVYAKQGALKRFSLLLFLAFCIRGGNDDWRQFNLHN